MTIENKETNTTSGTEGQFTFTQEDVNRILGERLAREKSKNEATLAEREQELAQRELRLTAQEQLASRGLSADLLDALNVSSPEALEKSLGIIEKLIDQIKNEQPQVKFKGVSLSEGVKTREIDSTQEGIRKAMGLAR